MGATAILNLSALETNNRDCITSEIVPLFFGLLARRSSAGHVGPGMKPRLSGRSHGRGDVIVGDADGVVVVPREAAIVAAAEQRLAKEEASRARLKAGELGLGMYRLRDLLAQRGVEWKD